MTRASRARLGISWGLALTLAGNLVARADDAGAERAVPPPLRGIRIDDHAGAQVPLDLALVDQDGARRTLGELCDGTVPMVLVLGYYRCPMLCGVVFERLYHSFAATTRVLGRDYRAAAVGIDPRETPADARARRDAVLGATAGALPASGWPFLVGDASTVRAVADAVGSRYRFDAPSGQWAHATGAFVLTPDGRISRSLTGLDFAPAILDRALDDAAAGRIASPGALEQVLVQCFRFMPTLRRHAGAIRGYLRAGAVALVLGLAAIVVVAARRPNAAREQRP